MRIIAKRALREFWQRYPDAESWLRAWYDQVRRADWDSPASVQREHPRASIVGRDRVVFRFKGNEYRMIVRVFYPGRLIYIRFIGTHTEYDRVNVEEV
ncbi:MAG: type II toxin-antitoxin system HigB family toxin [Deltaproteobacteria bacterium]|nr:type II toxin-antitoxin system HigB family toxin [Deltaproteobacteria bacterium]